MIILQTVVANSLNQQYFHQLSNDCEMVSEM